MTMFQRKHKLNLHKILIVRIHNMLWGIVATCGLQGLFGIWTCKWETYENREHMFCLSLPKMATVLHWQLFCVSDSDLLSLHA